MITDTKVQNLTYYPYGATRTNSSPVTPAVDVPYKYTGKELDGSTDLYYYGARYYDPLLARFLSADTLVPNPRDPQELNRYTYAGSNPFLYTDPTGHFKIKFTKFFKRALGEVGTTVLGVALQAMGPLGWTGNLVLGGAVLSQSKSGRYIIAGQMVAGTAIGAAACIAASAGSCAPIAGAAVGAMTGAAYGGYAADKNGGDLSSGLAFGATVGAVTGAINGMAWVTPLDPNIVLDLTLSRIITGALVGAGNGAIGSYAGGRGDFDSMRDSIARGAITGAALAAVLTGLDYALLGVAPAKNPFSDECLVLGCSPITLSSIAARALVTPGFTSLVVSVGSLEEVRNRTISRFILDGGFHCTTGTGGAECGRGSGTKINEPPTQPGEPF